MPVIYKSPKLNRSLELGELVAIWAVMEKRGLLPHYPERNDFTAIPVLDKCSNMTIAFCRTKDKKLQDEILARKPKTCNIPVEEIKQLA